MANVPISNIETEWDDAGTVYSGIKIDVTDTASNGSSKLLDLSKNNSTVMSVDKNGSVQCGSVQCSSVTAGPISGSFDGFDYTVRGPVTVVTGSDNISGFVNISNFISTMMVLSVFGDTTFNDFLSEGQYVLINLIGGSNFVITWPPVTWIGGSAPTLTSDDTLAFWKISNTLYGSYVGSGV